MNLRLLTLEVPSKRSQTKLESILEKDSVIDHWVEKTVGPNDKVRILIDSDSADEIVDLLEDAFGGTPDFRILLTAIEAAIPRPEVQEKDEEAEVAQRISDPKKPDLQRSDSPVNIEELYQDVTADTELSTGFLALSALAAIVASIGVLANDSAAVIAGMVIAPLLSPNISLALATVLGDTGLGLHALKVNAAGLLVVIGISVLFGSFYPLDPETSHVALRTNVSILQLILALSAGAAGALSFTSGRVGGVVGVMIAVALVPPAVVAGMLLGDGQWHLALGAFGLTFGNIICVNLAGAATFFLRNIQPRHVWAAERGKKFFHRALIVWTILLLLLIATLIFLDLWHVI